jgi:hypothetical protein
MFLDHQFVQGIVQQDITGDETRLKPLLAQH